MKLTGQQYFAGLWQAQNPPSWSSFDPSANQDLPFEFSETADTEIDSACEAAWQAFKIYRKFPAEKRAAFLSAIADEILALGDQLIETVMQESGLPRLRVEGERGRTINQLRLFANNLVNPYRAVLIDKAQPDREPLPKSDHRMGTVALGPIAVFGASNFPLAFSVAGGDTASALAAGCPVVVKSHPAHPATSELVTHAIDVAAQQTSMPNGVFALLQGQRHELSSTLVQHPRIQAVGFTGSNRVGLLLAKLAANRPQPIPFYGELGANNPQIILAETLANNTETLVEMQVSSMMMGHGQFCTCPGMILVVKGSGLDEYRQTLRQKIEAQSSGSMLTPGIAQTYIDQVEGYRKTLTLISEGRADGHHTAAAIFEVEASALTNELLDECFGPFALLVVCEDQAELLETIEKLHGQLSASIHGSEDELVANTTIIDALELKVGRLIFNQMPTGVEVCQAMFHGGPFPAATNAHFTSVGSEAILRFTRPICYQNMPDSIRPAELKEGATNPTPQ